MNTVQLRGRWPTHVFRVQRSQLTLFCIVSENKGFLSQNAAAEASNPHLHISTSKGHKGCRSNEALKRLAMIPQDL